MYGGSAGKSTFGAPDPRGPEQGGDVVDRGAGLGSQAGAGQAVPWSLLKWNIKLFLPSDGLSVLADLKNIS